MNIWILIFVFANSTASNVGSAAVQSEFTSEAKCKVSGEALSKKAYEARTAGLYSGAPLIFWGCYQK